VVIPNVELSNFENFLRNNFGFFIDNKKEEKTEEIKDKDKEEYYKANINKMIICEETKIKKFPNKFNLFIEVGLNSFLSHFMNKAKQINKYISFINFPNIIDNKEIKDIYLYDFRQRFGLFLNSPKNNEYSEVSVYILISDSDYGEFTYRFLDNKNFKFENEPGFYTIVPKESKEVLLCGFVEFSKYIKINSVLNWNNNSQEEKFEKRIKKVQENQKEEIAKLKKNQEEEIAKLKKNQEEEIAKLKKNQEKKISKLKKNQEEEIAKLKKDKEEEIKNIKQGQEDMKKMKKQYEEHNKLIADMINSIRLLTQQNQKLKEEIDQIGKDYNKDSNNK